MYFISNELLIQARMAEREREVREMRPRLSRPRRAALRAVLAADPAQLALRIDHDAASRATGRQAVHFPERRPSL